MHQKIKGIAILLNCKKDIAAKVYGLISGPFNLEDWPETKQWVNVCGYKPKLYELKLYTINNALNGCGVEYMETFKSGGISYCDTGNTNTVMYLHKKRAYIVGNLNNYIDV